MYIYFGVLFIAPYSGVDKEINFVSFLYAVFIMQCMHFAYTLKTLSYQVVAT